MIKKRSYPRNSAELTEVLVSCAHGAEGVVVQAGHFLLYYDHTEARVLAAIADKLDGPRHALIANEIGQYPLLTWQLAVPMLASFPVERKDIMVVVNDWQYLPDGVDRFDFYQRCPCLPGTYTSALARHPDVRLLSPRRKPNLDTGVFFSEQALRKAYERHVKRLIRNNELPANARVETGHEISCSLEDFLGRKKEIYCSGKRQNCTHEVAELVWTVHELTKTTLFINFFPIVCKEFMIEGTELSRDLFHHGVRTVVNVGMQSSHVLNEGDLFSGAEVIVHDFTS